MNEDVRNKKYELIGFIILFILCLTFYYKWDVSVKDHKAYVKAIDTGKTVSDINKPTEEVKQREAELYPKIDANIAQINKDVKTLAATLKRIEANQPTKEQSNEIFKNKSLAEVSDFFAANQFPNTVTSR